MQLHCSGYKPHNVRYSPGLGIFKIKHAAYLYVKDEVEPKVPKINNKDKNRKIIHWSLIFKDFLASSSRSSRPLSHALR